VKFKAGMIRNLLGDSQGSLAQAAIRFVLAHPAIASINFGARNLDEFEEGLAAFDMGPLPEPVMADLDALFHSDFGRG
jgi:aryl-alcohol dehydrogenase-like predicted oxidoreductase